MDNKIVCMGEILWDSLPLGLFLGGAPYNVACHLRKLGEDVLFVSRVGDDLLGREAVKRVQKAGLSAEYLQKHKDLNTGFVEVSIKENGIPDYDIKMPAAWDEIVLNSRLERVMEQADAIVFGTLAQRSEISAMTIQWVENCNGLKVLDLNFRFPHVDEDTVERSLKISDVVKLNEDELNVLQSWYNLSTDIRESIEAIVNNFSLQTVCLTLGSKGAVLWNEGEFIEASGYRVDVVDTVGSGDAFLAAFLSGYLGKKEPVEMLKSANQLGAFVATRLGGTPDYTFETVEEQVQTS